MKKWGSVFLVLTVLVLAMTVLPIHGEEEIYDSVIRLHVLANSDSEEDQSLKLKVRDAVLLTVESLFTGGETRAQAAEILSASLDTIAKSAAECLSENGSSYTVRVSLGEEEYPTRQYEKLALPAGKYLSLRVMIGEAAGENWWCVLFPPLCLSVASAREENNATLLSAGLTEEQYRMITDTGDTKYRLRFKILETAEGLLR